MVETTPTTGTDNEPDSGAERSKAKGKRGRISEDELDARVDATEQLLARGVKKSDIKRAIKAKYGVSARTVENYISRARTKLLARISLDQGEQRAASLAFYQSILASSATVNEKIKAQRAIDNLLGLNRPIEKPGEGKGDMTVDEARAVLSTLAQRIQAMDADGDADANDRAIRKVQSDSRI